MSGRPTQISHWLNTSLGEVFDFIGGGTPDKKESNYWGGDVPWASVKDFGQKYIEDTIDHITEEGFENSSSSMAIPGDLIVLTRISPGKSAIPRTNIAINQDCKIARPKIDINLVWAFYWFLANERDISSVSSGTTVLGIRLNNLKSLPVNLPPLEEQNRIVAKIEELFSELDDSVANLETARARLQTYRQSLLKHAFEGRLTEQWRRDHADELESADQLLKRIREERQARYQQQLEDWKAHVAQWEADGKSGKKPRKPKEPKELPAFEEEELGVLPSVPESWKFVRLGTIAQIGSGMAVSKSRKLEYPVEVPYLRVANVQRGKLDLDEVKTMEVERSELEALRLKKWDVLFNEGGDRDKLGRGWVWESQIEPCITQNHVFRASPWLEDEFHSKFISYWGNAFGRDYFEKAGKQTTNLASINKTVLSMFPVPVPPLEEQREIVRLLEGAATQMDEMENEISDALEREKVLRQSILKHAFEGRLVPQDSSNKPSVHLSA